MPSGGQFSRPMQMQPMMPNYRDSSSDTTKDEKNQRTYCVFSPTDNANFPAYYEHTTSTTVSPHIKNRQDDKNDNGRENDENCEFLFIYLFLMILPRIEKKIQKFQIFN